ncbi:hypothetical protein [Vreelandella neptunia]|uniref:hypothetical protein n=1 Tax=Vreelandella neptunia TaxID=115551 RepID=UPI003159E279
MFAKLRDDYLRLRKRAVKDGMPDWAVLHADLQANVGLFARKRALGQRYQVHYNRAVREMFAAVELLRAYLQREGRLRRRNAPLLNELLEAKK